ncbi:MAG: hypothetical protein MET45_10530 [Nostoc sp. LLA-1]|nr:hypothetical protein [Cyanocohniella sp. LLY]
MHTVITSEKIELSPGTIVKILGYRLQGENYIIAESSYFANVREIVQQCLQIANEQTTSEAIRWLRAFLHE